MPDEDLNREQTEKAFLKQRPFSRYPLYTDPNFLYIHDLIENRSIFTSRSAFETLGIKSQEFYRLKDLVLSISYGIVKDHHGDLNVESEFGQYTRFHMDLPADNKWTLVGG